MSSSATLAMSSPVLDPTVAKEPSVITTDGAEVEGVAAGIAPASSSSSHDESPEADEATAQPADPDAENAEFQVPEDEDDSPNPESIMRGLIWGMIGLGVTLVIAVSAGCCYICSVQSDVEQRWAEFEAAEKAKEEAEEEAKKAHECAHDQKKAERAQHADAALQGTFSMYVQRALQKMFNGKLDEEYGDIDGWMKTNGLDTSKATKANIISAVEEQVVRIHDGNIKEYQRARAIRAQRDLEKAVHDANEKQKRNIDKYSNACAHVSGICYGLAGFAAFACRDKDGYWCSKPEAGGQFYCCAPSVNMCGQHIHWETATFIFGFIVMFLLMCLWGWEFFAEDSYNEYLFIDEESFLKKNPDWAPEAIV